MKSSFLYELIDPPQDGRAHIVGNEVEWCVDIVDGRMLFAAHSLQYLTAFESVLPALGYESALPAYWRLITLDACKHRAEETGIEALSWTSKVLSVLIQHGSLDAKQAKRALYKLSEEAIFALLGLESATIHWYELPAGAWHLNHAGIELASFVQALIPRLQLWEPLSDRIMSPYQRPYCDDLESIYQPVPSGRLPQPTLETLVRLMQGATLRDLARVTKLDELKLAQLLYPYIAHRTIKLWPPVSPLDQLPWIPTQTQALQSITTMSGGSRHYTPAPHSAHKYSSTTSTTPSSTQNVPLARSALAVKLAAATPIKSIAIESTAVVPTTAEPAAAKPAAAEPAVIKGKAPPHGTPNAVKSRYCIVCIDDNQLLLNKIHDFLDDKRFELHSVLDPIGSIAKICSLQPDLILLDITMPRIDGHNLCKVLRRGSKVKHTPIVMISSNTSTLNKAKAKAAGATDYLEKPFTQSQLTDVMNVYLPP